jgi:hypothetical protein
VLEIAGRRVHAYRTIYFDTEDMVLYRRHHAGNESRFKVRSRQYVDSQICFLEVKHKTNKDYTIKDRMQTSELVSELDPSNPLLTKTSLGKAQVDQKLRSEFLRTTLVSNRGRERATIDVRLNFAGNGREADLPGVAVVEVKQARFDRTSPIIAAMRSAGVPPRGISKYCLGVSLLYPEVKHNSFKPQLTFLERLMRGSGHE